MHLENVTEARKRRYDDACGMSHALDLIGERWALPIMRELFFGPKRFNDLRADLPGISANVLTQRLTGLEEAGVVTRRRLPPPASVQVYDLTDWGREVEPIIQTLGRWAARSPAHDPSMPLSAASLMLSFRTMFDPARVPGLAARIAFSTGRETHIAEVKDGRLEAARHEIDGSEDAVVTAPPTHIAAVVYGGQPLDMLRIEGDKDKVRRFFDLFELPPKAGPT